MLENEMQKQNVFFSFIFSSGLDFDYSNWINYNYKLFNFIFIYEKKKKRTHRWIVQYFGYPKICEINFSSFVKKKN